MAEPATIDRRRPPPRVFGRNQLADVDALIERALVAAQAGRDASPFTADAERLAAELAFTASLCQVHALKPFEALHLRRFLELATKAGQLDARAQLYAGSAKAYLRARICECARRALSISGRPLW